jgi:hypothetical protein
MGGAGYCINEQYSEALGGGRSGDQQRDRDPDRDQFEHQIHGGEVSGFGVLRSIAQLRSEKTSRARQFHTAGGQR